MAFDMPQGFLDVMFFCIFHAYIISEEII
jgi:hypothetical protein